MSPIILDCEQGSPEWGAARLGVTTASMCSKILTPTGRPSSARDEYVGKLLAEWALGEPVEEFMGTYHTERGKGLEPMALAHYRFQHDADVRKVGFVFRDADRLAGCSPDALVGEDGGLELKCPSPGNHLIWWLHGTQTGEIPKKHMPQVQFSLWVTGRKWWDWMSFHPDLPPFLVRIAPDPKWQAALDACMPAVFDEIRAGRESADGRGLRPGGGGSSVTDFPVRKERTHD